MTDNSPAVDESGESIISKLWERNYDPLTTRIIEGLPIQRTWRCLDLGAGTGSMSYWLAGRADQGSVLAVDIDTRHLDPARAPNLTVRKADITSEDFAPESFDLILGRAFFAQLPQPDEQLARVAQWLAPGGWLVVEDFYFLPDVDAPNPVGRAVIHAYLEAFRANGVDTRWARGLPSTLAQLGLRSVGMHVTPLGPGQGAYENELMRARLEWQGQPLVDNGLVSAEHLAEFIATLDHPEARDVATLELSVWGRRPIG